MNTESARLQAQNDNTAPEILAGLSNNKDYQTRQYVAANPNTPTETLLKLGAEFPRELLNNPVFNLLILEDINFVNNIPLPTLRSILRQQDVPEYILEQACDRADLEVQLSLVNSLKVSSAILQKLVDSTEYSEVAEAAKLHVNLVGEIAGDYKTKLAEIIKSKINSKSDRDNLSPLSFQLLAQVGYIPDEIVAGVIDNNNYKLALQKIAKSSTTSAETLTKLFEYNYIQIQQCLKQEYPFRSGNFSLFSLSNCLAQNPNISVENLVLLSKYPVDSVKKSVAGNLNTPMNILEQLAIDKNVEIRFAVAKNINVYLELLQTLAIDENNKLADFAAVKIIVQYNEAVQFKTCNRDNVTTLRSQDELGLSAIELKLSQVTRLYPDDFNLTPKILENIVKKYPQFVASHSQASVKLLQRLSSHQDSKIRYAVADNVNTPANILRKLASDRNRSVRSRVANHQNTPLNILFTELARDTKINYSIASNLSNKTVQSIERIQDILAENSASPLKEVLHKLIYKGDTETWIFLAKRKDIAPEFIKLLSQISEQKVQTAVATNPNVSSEILEYFLQDNQAEVLHGVATNIKTSRSIIRQLFNKLRNSRHYSDREETNIFSAIARHSNTPTNVLARLATYNNSKVYSNNAKVRRLALSNPKLTTEIVEQILGGEYAVEYLQYNPNYLKDYPNSIETILNNCGQSQLSLVAYISLLQPQISKYLLIEKSRSVEWLKRCAVAQNTNTAKNILQTLAKDCNQLVCAAAQDNMSKKSQLK